MTAPHVLGAPFFEAIKYALRQSKDGVVVSFVVHPSDVGPELMAMPIGARVMVAWAQIGDDEKRIDAPKAKEHSPPTGRVNEPPVKISEAKERRKFSELPLVQQCAMRCEDENFQRFLNYHHRVQDHAETFPEMVRSLLNVNSRSELATNKEAAEKWRKLNSDFEAWKLDQRYPSEARR